MKNPVVEIKNTKEQVIEYINTLQGYEGYVQFSHRPIKKEDDIFYEGKVVNVEDEEGFVYEAYFFNTTKNRSISIRQINDKWYISSLKDVILSDTQSYMSRFGMKVRMAQIWSEEKDAQCEGMKVKKLQQVVFAGFDTKRVKEKQEPENTKPTPIFSQDERGQQ